MIMAQKELQIKTLSSLAKVFAHKIVGSTAKRADAFCGCEAAFQVALRLPMKKYCQTYYDISVNSPLEEYITLSRVGNVPSMLPVYPDRADKGYITTSPAIFPDPLFPITDGKFRAAVMNWRAIWVSVNIPENYPSGKYPVVISFSRKGETVAKAKFEIEVHSLKLPPQELLYTQWFHCDCIADIHKVPVLSEAHWTLIYKYMKLAAEHGMNMILTPVLTPPLDTEIGTERPTVQLVEVTKNENGYTFDFSLLERFVDMALSVSITNFEISHFFTQWGAYCTPKVVAKVNGKKKKIFGWKTAATCDEYAEFLRTLVPELIAFFVSKGVDKKALFFHVSDEPREEHIESYKAAAAILCPLVKECNHMDALSAFDFYKLGLVETPVVASNHIVPYLEADVKGLWTYYCCSQCKNTSNRFMAMPSPRTRIIGVQMYKYDIVGFLQWGYNFYYTQLSKRLVDPYAETDSDAAFPSGDAFTVYPYEDGVIPSLRQKVFSDALNDMRLLKLLEAKIGKEKVVAELDRLYGEPITFETSFADESFFTKLYEMIFSYLEN